VNCRTCRDTKRNPVWKNSKKRRKKERKKEREREREREREKGKKERCEIKSLKKKRWMVSEELYPKVSSDSTHTHTHTHTHYFPFLPPP
jgi:hypothetical protein